MSFVGGWVGGFVGSWLGGVSGSVVSGGIWISDKKSYRKRLHRMMQVAERREPKKYKKEAERLVAYVKRAELPVSLIPATVAVAVSDAYAATELPAPNYERLIVEIRLLLKLLDLQIANQMAQAEEEELAILLLI
jgi:hypothetical protein